MALKNYEIVMVYSLSKGEEAVNALKTKFTDLISKNGTLGEVEEWGKRKLLILSTTKQRDTMFLSISQAMKNSRQSSTV